MRAARYFLSIFLTLATAIGLMADLAFAQSLGFSSDDVSMLQYFDYYGKPENETSCPLFAVHSYGIADDKAFRQHGVGWSVLSKGDFFIVSPYHVVSGGKIIYLQCNDFIAEAYPVSWNEKKDLALLKMNPADLVRLVKDHKGSILPMIGLGLRDVIRGSIKEKDPAKLRAIDHFLFPKLETLEMQSLLKDQVGAGINSLEVGDTVRPISFSTQRVTRNFIAAVYENPAFAPSMMGIKKPLSIEFSAIRPGYSGSALYVQRGADVKFIQEQARLRGESAASVLLGQNGDSSLPKYLIGMITKTELNSNRSLAIPISDILDFIREETKTENRSNDGFLIKSGYTQNDLFKTTSSSLYNVSELVDILNSRSFSPSCISDFKHTADLEKIDAQKIKSSKTSLSLQNLDMRALKRLKSNQTLNPTITPLQRRGGGDIGEGSGPSKLTSDLQFKKYFPSGAEDRPTAFGFAYLKSNLQCKNDGLLMKTKDGKEKIVTMVEANGRFYKTTSLSEVWNATTKNKDANLEPILTQHPLCANGFSKKERKEFFFSSPEVFQMPNADNSLMRTLKIVRSSDKRTQMGSLSCSEDLTQLKLDLNYDFAPGWPFRIKFNADFNKNISGSIEVGSCRISFDSQTTASTSIWEHSFANDSLTGKISLDTEGRPVKVAFTNISPACLDRTVLDLYTIEIWNPGAWK